MAEVNKEIPLKKEVKEKKKTFSEKVISRFSAKSDKFKYVCELDEMQKHEELYATPHARQLFAQYFEGSM